MRLLSVDFSGIGSCPEMYSLEFPPSTVSLMQMKTGGKKTLACEAILHAFGHDMPRARMLATMNKDNEVVINVRLEHDKGWMSIKRVDNGSSTWIVKEGGKEMTFDSRDEFQSFLLGLSIDAGIVKNCVVSDQSASVDILSIVPFLQSSSKKYRVIGKYQTVLHEMLGACKTSILELKRRMSTPVDMSEMLRLTGESEDELNEVSATLERLNDEKNMEQDALDALETRLKTISDLETKIEIIRVKISSLGDLIATKKENIRECEQKIDEHEKRKSEEKIMECSRKTEVSLDALLKNVETTLSGLIERRGSLEMQLKEARILLGTALDDQEKNDKTIVTETAKIVAMGIKDDGGKEAVLREIARKNEIINENNKKNKVFVDGISLMKSALNIVKKHGIHSCPCCGHDYRDPEKLEEKITVRLETLSDDTKIRDSTLKLLRAELRGLNKYDDVKRKLETTREKGKILAVNVAGLEEKIATIEHEIESTRARVDILETEKSSLIEQLKAEERMIDISELKQKIIVARTELEKLENTIVEMKNEEASLVEEMNAFQTVSAIKEEITGIKKRSRARLETIVSAKIKKSEIEMRIIDLSASVESNSNLEEKMSRLESRRKVINDHLSLVIEMEKFEEEKIKRISKKVGVEIGLDVVSLNSSTNEVIHRINGIACKQNLISMSTGEKVVTVASLLARNDTWNSGGFILIDANISADLVHECAETLLQQGCEQVIFLMTGDEDKTIEVEVIDGT